MTLENLDIKPLLPVLENFKINNFNNLKYDERISAIKSLSELICNQLICDGFNINFELLQKEDLQGVSAGYNTKTKTVELNKDIINKEHVTDVEVFCILKDIIHETVHCVQDKKNMFSESLGTSFQNGPYYIYQGHERDAHQSVIKLFKDLKNFLDPAFIPLIDFLEDEIKLLELESESHLARRGYDFGIVNAVEQLNLIMPFYKEYYRYIDLINDDASEKATINYNKTEINIVKDESDWYCNIIINGTDGQNNLYCCIGPICRINELYMRTSEKDVPVDAHTKNDLLVALNKIINIYNKRHRGAECASIEIMPISLVENKNDYNRFLSKDHKIKDVKFDVYSKIVTMSAIEEQCKIDTLNYNIEKNYNIKTDYHKIEEHDLNSSNDVR